jgi:hypothetical protein
VTADKILALVLAFRSACGAQVRYEMCPKWRTRRKEHLRKEKERAWLTARILRDKLADGS